MKRCIAKLILFTENEVNILDKLIYLRDCLITFAPIAFMLHWFNWWFEDNRQFANFLFIALFLNMFVGLWFHYVHKTLSMFEFLKKNSLMIFACTMVYASLELLRYTAGDNTLGEAFKITIQLMTLLFPVSKITKNMHILTNGEFPPEFFIKRLYNFEKDGNLKDFYNGKFD